MRWPEAVPVPMLQDFVKTNRGISCNEMPLFLSVYSWYDDEGEGICLPPAACRAGRCRLQTTAGEHNMIVPVTDENVREAAGVYARGWRASHEAFCTPEFLAKHTDIYQLEYLKKEIQNGKSFFLLLAPGPAGVVSVQGPLLEHLYVLPQMQGRGFGTRLLRFALAQGAHVLWVLDNNRRAIGWYESWGFAFTGRAKQLSPALQELEMARRGLHAAPGVHERENGI